MTRYFWIYAIITLALCFLALWAIVSDRTNALKKRLGTIIAVNHDHLVVRNLEDSKELKQAFAMNMKVEIGGKAAQLKDLRLGDRVTIRSGLWGKIVHIACDRPFHL